MAPKIAFSEPLPFFHHAASERVLYVTHGPSPSPLVFSIGLKDVARHELICRGPVLTNATHPFGTSTGVSSLVEGSVRRGLAEAEIFEDPGFLQDTLELWRDFCDAVAERLQNDEDLELALAMTWVLENAEDVDLNDLAANSAVGPAALTKPHGAA
ncbi:MAG TPA: hypothetical protein VGB85_05600 [Nannocystis sp.]|jgi:hypothetical protein